MDKSQHIVVPLPDCVPEIGSVLWMIEDTRRRTLREIADLELAAIDYVGGFNQHSIGTLLYHIAAIELDWLYVEVLESDIPPEMARWFPVDVRDSQSRISAVRGETLAEHLERLAYVRHLLLNTYQTMTLAEYRRPRSLEHYDVTPEWVLHHLMQHEAGHREEICALRDQASRKSKD